MARGSAERGDAGAVIFGEEKREMEGKVVIYEVFPRLWGNENGDLAAWGDVGRNGVGKFSSFSEKRLGEIRAMGVTHVWYMGVLSHATQTDYSRYGLAGNHPAVVKGRAGSPYAVRDYYDVSADLADDVAGRMGEFERLVKRTHEAGLKVLIDFVPNHVSRQYRSVSLPAGAEDLGVGDDSSVAFARDNNYYYLPGEALRLEGAALDAKGRVYAEEPARATGNDLFAAHAGRGDWYETVKLNYGVDYVHGGAEYFEPCPDTWGKMLDILRFWLGKGVDGFRCDMVEMTPAAFWKWAIARVREEYAAMFIGEAYRPEAYGAYLESGFDYLYDKAGLYDTLRGVMTGVLPAAAGALSSVVRATAGIRGRLLAFVENHDEQRIASDYFAGDARAGIPATMVALLMDVNPFMLYNGQELGERGMDAEGFSGLDGRTTIFDYWSMSSVRGYLLGRLTAEQEALRNTYMLLMQIARREAAVREGKFYDLTEANAGNARFDGRHQYAFLRYCGEEVILVVVNFAGESRLTGVRLPADAFVAMGIGENRASHTTDLLTGERSIGALTSVCAYELVVPPLSGKVIKFRYDI